MTTDDPLFAALAQLDPTTSELPPQRGSVRDDQILERAMRHQQQQQQSTEPRSASGGEPPDPPETDTYDLAIPIDRPAPPRPRARWAAPAAAAAIVAAAIVAAVVTTEDAQHDAGNKAVAEDERVAAVVTTEDTPPPTPIASIAAAADATGEVTTLRVRATYDTGDGTPSTMEGEIDGRSYQSRFTSTDPETGEESSNTRTVIGNQQWETDGDDPSPRTITPEEVNAPYPEASRAVVRAALKGATVRVVGPEDVAGVATTHYEIELGPQGTRALAALTPSELARFELEYPAGVVSLDVWVADDLIRRIHVRSDFEDPSSPGSVIEFYDFGADITIEPPD